jgi:glyoxylase-like metal-dependent hydrolase (beta-lactamase superfamily II)
MESYVIQIEQIGEVTRFRLARAIFGKGIYFTAAYHVDGLLVDSGCHHTVDELVGSINGRSVDLVVNTHSHEDHIAANLAMQNRFESRVLAHPLALPRLACPEKQRLRPYQLVLWGRPVPSEAEPIGEYVETEKHRFQVIHTPGHCSDHVCLYEPDEGWLFTGDTYVGGRDKALRLDYDIWEIIESLKKLAALDADMIFPGSGTVYHNPQEALRTKIDYLEEMGGRVWYLHDQGMSRRRIRQRLFGSEPAIAYITLGHFCGRNLVRSYLEDRPAIVSSGES